MNKDSIQTWYDLYNPIVPKSIAHGITSVWLPKKIGFFERKGNKLELIESGAFKRDMSSPSLSNLNNPWCLYSSLDAFPIDLSKFNKYESDVSIHEIGKQILVKTQNALNQDKYIAIEFDSDNAFQNISNNFPDYKYAFKAFIEKLQFLHRSSSLNLNSSSWYKKAFCKLYRDFDELRFNGQYKELYNHKSHIYRDWEDEIIKPFLNKVTNPVIYNFGSCYGRFEKKLFGEWNLKNELEVVYSIDQNQDYLKDIIDLNYPKVKTKRCDFRSITLFDKKEAHLVCFLNTTFGYFINEKENILVLIKAYELLRVGGKLIIDQFNPENGIKHEGVKEFYFPNKENCEYKLIKTSNLTKVAKNDIYGKYYGNYMYFRIIDSEEKLVKCDTYDIKLYTKKWFQKVLNIPSNYIKVSKKDRNSTMVIEINKRKKFPSKYIEEKQNLGEKISIEVHHPDSI